MSKFKVINRFKDLKHDGHIYEVGDIYPADGKPLVKSRADFLTKVHKDYGVAFLEEIKEPTTTAKTTTKTAKTETVEKSDK